MGLRSFWRRFIALFTRRRVQLGLYGPPNGGKTTLANRICADWLGEEMGSTSRIAHETRDVHVKERITIRNENGKELTFALADTPGIATRIDAADFVREGLEDTTAKGRAKEAAKGVLKSVEHLAKIDCVIVVLDATKEPYNQVNATLLEAVEKRGIPTVLVANKIDLKKADVERVRAAFPDQDVLGISAKYGDNIEAFYAKLFELVERSR
jgi:small GTP-binding protein